jgi:hypothetical protein
MGCEDSHRNETSTMRTHVGDPLPEIQTRLEEGEHPVEHLKDDLAWCVAEILRLRKQLAVSRATLIGTVLALNDARHAATEPRRK